MSMFEKLAAAFPKDGHEWHLRDCRVKPAVLLAAAGRFQAAEVCKTVLRAAAEVEKAAGASPNREEGDSPSRPRCSVCPPGWMALSF